MFSLEEELASGKECLPSWGKEATFLLQDGVALKEKQVLDVFLGRRAGFRERMLAILGEGGHFSSPRWSCSEGEAGP